MDTLKRYIIRNFEAVIVLMILLSVGIINYLLPYKLAFLNFYYIPVLLTAYYLGPRMAVLGAILCVAVVGIYVALSPTSFATHQGDAFHALDLAASVGTWGCFLILTGAVVGRLHRNLEREIEQTRALTTQLAAGKSELEETARQLREHTQHLEAKVTERTESLQRSKEAIEELKGKVEEALYTTMDSAVVKLLIEKRLHTEKRPISVLLCDLQGFTRYSEDQRPEVVVTELNRLFTRLETILLTYQAHIDKYMGDAILCEFGAPLEQPRHALLSVVAGLKMQAAVQQGNFPWPMRVAITTGEAIVGLIGHKRQSYTALGDVVNLASRVEKLCPPGRITVDEATWREVQEFVEGRRRPATTLSDAVAPDFEARLSACEARLAAQPDDVAALREMARLWDEVEDVAAAQACLKRALTVAPDDTAVKVAYAEASLKLEAQGKVSIRGKHQRILLYEVVGLKHPLLNRERLPQAVYDRHAATVDRLVPYPEDLLLPVECLDGSVGHSRVVGLLAYAVAEELGLPDMEKRTVLEAGYLADIGKTIIPTYLRNRGGALTGLDYEEFAKHCREGVRKLRQLGYESQALFDMVEHHHENLNGSGYPDGLAGDQIPLGARIIGVADAYAAMTSWRPYRDRWEHRAAFAEMEKEAARGKYDPAVLAALGRVLGLRA